MSFLTFIKSKTFLKQLLLLFSTIALLLFIVFKSLSSFTNHGEYIEVPDYSNVKMEDVKQYSARYGLRDTIIDFVFDDSKPPGVVVSQDPEPQSKVKHNRTIYLYVTSLTPQMVNMPDLIDASPRQAIQSLETYGLKIDKVLFRSGINCVQEQLVNGKSVRAGTEIPKNTKITLVVGKGDEDKLIAVPCVDGLTLAKAISRLYENSLIPGEINCEGCKSSEEKENAVVVGQSPSCVESDNMVDAGSAVSITVKPQKNKKKK